MVKNLLFIVISLSVYFQASVQKATMSKIMRQINQSYFEFFTLIGLRGLRGIKSKNGVSSIESVIFFYGIIIGMIIQTIWT